MKNKHARKSHSSPGLSSREQPVFLHDTIVFFFFKFYRNIVDLECCVNFSCTTKWLSYTFVFFIWFFSSVHSLSRVRLFATPWTAAQQASLSITNSWSLPRLMSIELVRPSKHLILCRPLLLLPSIFPSIRVFSNELARCMRWPKYWSFSFNISFPMNTQDWSPLEWIGWISLQSKGLSRVFSNTTVQKHQFFGTQLSSQSKSHIHTWLLENS